MKKLKILQDWPLLHNGKALKRGDVAEFDDKYADWLLAHGRAEADKSLKTGGNNSAQASRNKRTGKPGRTPGQNSGSRCRNADSRPGGCAQMPGHCR